MSVGAGSLTGMSRATTAAVMAGIEARRWTPEQARAWYDTLPWLVGCNFIPSTASNQLEMWQAETFDLATINAELTLAAATGMNAVRVYLHDLLWLHDREAFCGRVDAFLGLCAKHGIKALIVLFDDCWHDDARPGPQPEPSPGVHNSRWLKSPGLKAMRDRAEWPRLKEYVQGVLTRFGHDPRILMWDLYNEPTNHGMPQMALPAITRWPNRNARPMRARRAEEASLTLLRETFVWAQAARPTQPLTAGIWNPNRRLNAFLVRAVDVVTFHNYLGTDDLVRVIRALKREGRPVICTEWMARPHGSRIETHLAIFQRERVGCFIWGLVQGRTNTIWAWEHPMPDGREPPLWFHDLYRPDHTPYRDSEIALFRQLAAEGAAPALEALGDISLPEGEAMPHKRAPAPPPEPVGG